MALTVHVAGPTEVYVDTGAGSSYEALGYSRNGIDLRFEPFWQDVPGDEHGGDQGPPIEVLYLLEKATVRMELTKWDRAIERKVTPRLLAGVEGQPGTVATKMFAQSKTYKLVLQSTGRPWMFERAILRGAVEISHGARYSSLVLEWECYMDADGHLFHPWGTSSESGTD